MLQQHLPFTVLKPYILVTLLVLNLDTVATAPTVYGIETEFQELHAYTLLRIVATAPTVYGIETFLNGASHIVTDYRVATAPTVYGIETQTAPHR